MRLKALLGSAVVCVAGITGATFISPANAQYSCFDNGYGTVSCSGSINGQRINTRSFENGYGTTTTTGTFGGQRINQSCFDNGYGTVSCN